MDFSTGRLFFVDQFFLIGNTARRRGQNGFSGGLIAIVLYPVLTSLVRHRRPVLQEEDYFAAMEEVGPLEEDELDTRRSDDPPPS